RDPRQRRHKRNSEQQRGKDECSRLGAGDCFDELDLRLGIGLCIFDELLGQLTVRRRLRRNIGGRQPPSLSSASSSSLARPLLSSRATTNPTTAAPASAMPGLL